MSNLRLARPGVWRTTTVIAAGVLAASVIVASRGAIHTVGADPNAVSYAAPAWAAPCRSREPRHDRELLRSCARVSGRVLAVKREADSTEEPETHLAMIADFHLLVVKIGPHHPPPSIGSAISVVGPIVRARNGLREVDAVQVSPL